MRRERVYVGANPYLLEHLFGKESIYLKEKECECGLVKDLRERVEKLEERVEKLEKTFQKDLESLERELWQGKREEVEQL